MTTIETPPPVAAARAMPSVLKPCDGKDFARDVHVAAAAPRRKLKRRSVRVDEWLVRVSAPQPILVIGLAMMIVFFIASTLAHLAGVQIWLTASVLGSFVLLLVLIPFVVVRLRARSRRVWAGTFDQTPDERFRLRLIAPANVVSRIGELSNDPFEPRVFRLFFALPEPRWMAMTMLVVLSVLAIGGLVLLKMYMPWGTGRAPQAWEVWGCLALATLPFAVLWPMYLRVCPGRLDLFRYSMSGFGAPRVRSFDLRECAVEINLSGRYVIITPPGGARSAIHLGWRTIDVELAKAMLEAARWRHETPPVPMDQLVG